MDSPYLVINQFITSLEDAITDLAPEGLRWKVADRHLQLTPLPEGLIPNYLVLTRALPGGTWLASDGAVGVVHAVGENHAEAELEPAVRELVERLATLLVGSATATLVDALDVYTDWNAPIGGISRIDLVTSGLCRATSVFLEGHPGAREEAAALVPWVSEPLSSDNPNARSMNEGDHSNPLVYCAMSATDGEQLRDLEMRMATGDALTGEDLEAYGMLRGIPRCCINAFDPALLQVPPRREHAAWLDSFLAAATREGATPVTMFSPYLNFLSALVYQLFFLKHLPCGPGCVSSEGENRRALDTLYDPIDAAVVGEMLSSSYICWPDGRLVPFRCVGIDGDTIRVADLGRFQWPDHMAAEYRELLRTGVPGATDGGAVNALRWTGSRWEIHAGDTWALLRERGRWFRSTHPKVVLFGAQSNSH